MRRIPETWIVWTILGLVVAIDLAAVALGILDRYVQSLVATTMFSIVTVGFATIGALIVWRHRAHSIGWLFIAVAFFFSLLPQPGAELRRLRPGRRPRLVAGGQGGVLVRVDRARRHYLGAMLLLLLLFPDGRPLTPRWRPVVGAAILAMILDEPGRADFTASRRSRRCTTRLRSRDRG